MFDSIKNLLNQQQAVASKAVKSLEATIGIPFEQLHQQQAVASKAVESLETTIGIPFEQLHQQNHKLLAQMEERIKASTAEIARPLSLLNQQQAVASKAVKSLEATIGIPFEQLHQQNSKLLAQIEERVKASTAEIARPYAAVCKPCGVSNQQYKYLQNYTQQISIAQMPISLDWAKEIQELTKAYMAVSTAMPYMEEESVEQERLEQVTPQPKKEPLPESAKVPKVKKKNRHKFSWSVETMYCFLPEDWRSNVEVRIQRQKKKAQPDYLVWILVVRCLMELSWAAVEIGWDNLWQPNDREIE